MRMGCMRVAYTARDLLHEYIYDLIDSEGGCALTGIIPHPQFPMSTTRNT